MISDIKLISCFFVGKKRSSYFITSSPLLTWLCTARQCQFHSTVWVKEMCCVVFLIKKKMVTRWRPIIVYFFSTYCYYLNYINNNNNIFRWACFFNLLSLFCLSFIYNEIITSGYEYKYNIEEFPIKLRNRPWFS